MNAPIDIPTDPFERKAWIRLQLAKSGLSLQSLAREKQFSYGSLRQAMVRKKPRAEQIIADAIGASKEAIWPERYTRNTDVLEAEFDALELLALGDPTGLVCPSDPSHRDAWIKYQLELRGKSFTSLAREMGCTRQAVHKTLRSRFPRMERAIATAICFPAAAIWPERYEDKGGEQ